MERSARSQETGRIGLHFWGEAWLAGPSATDAQIGHTALWQSFATSVQDFARSFY